MVRSSLQLSKEATEYRFNPIVPLKLYLKTCVSILEEAQSSFQSGDLERSYLMYLRYLDLCMNKLAKHLHVTSPSPDQEIGLYKREYLQLMKLEVPAILKITEDIKIQIDDRYNKYTLSLAKNVAKKTTTNREIQPAEKHVELPSTFSESKFNKSISLFRQQNVALNSSTKKKESNLLYPELPTLNYEHVTHPTPAFF